MKVKGKIQIGRVISNSEDDYIIIDLEDQTSNKNFATAKLSLQNFAKAITSQTVECEIEVRSLEKVGKKREIKYIQIDIPNSTNEEEIKTIISSFEIDGWKGNLNDVKNHHNRIKSEITGTYDCYKVLFERYINIEEKDEQKR
jgi:hypothetical protein